MRSTVKQRLTLALVLCVTLVTAGCELPTPETAADKQLKPQLIGRWFRESKLEGDEGTAYTLLENKTGDRFEMNLKIVKKNDIPRRGARFGKWYVVHGFYKHKIRVRNGVTLDRRDLSAYSTFRIVSVSNTEFVLEDPLDHHLITYRKVGRDFTMP